MAKKTRKKASAKRTNKSKKKGMKKSRLAPKKKKNVARKKRKGKIARAYSALVDTFKGTAKMRNKLEQPGTSESE